MIDGDNPQDPSGAAFDAEAAAAAERVVDDVYAPIQEGVIHGPHKPKEGRWRGNLDALQLEEHRNNIGKAFLVDQAISHETAKTLLKENDAALDNIIEQQASRRDSEIPADASHNQDDTLRTLDVSLERVGNETITLEGYKKGDTVIKPFDKGSQVASVDSSDPRLLNNRSGKHYSTEGYRQ